jgi:hypothetical protein
MYEFKAMFEIKANEKIKEEKPSTTTLGSNRGGGKFNVPIFSNLQDNLSRLYKFRYLLVSKFQVEPFPTHTNNPRGKLLSHFHFLFQF